MKNIFFTSVLVCLVLGFSHKTMAGITMTETYDFPVGITPYSDVINVAQENYTFGTGVGQIDSITITIVGYIETGGSVSNPTGSNLKVYSLTQTGDITASLADSTLLDEVFPVAVVIGSTTTVNKNSSLPFSGVDGTDTEDSTYSDSTTVNQFLGAGTVEVDMGATSISGFTAQTGLSFTSSDDVWGQFIISYDVVPEPSTWISGALLLGVVSVGAGRSLWRKRNQAVA